jgi:hypothetical protein
LEFITKALEEPAAFMEEEYYSLFYPKGNRFPKTFVMIYYTPEDSNLHSYYLVKPKPHKENSTY